MTRKIYPKLFIGLLLLFFICLPVLALAQDETVKEDFPNLGDVEKTLINSGGTQGVGVDTKATTAEGAIYKTIGTFIGIVINIIGIISVAFLAYAGWLWASARGNEEKVERAKRIIFDAIIALIIVLGAWLIYNAVFALLLNTDMYV